MGSIVLTTLSVFLGMFFVFMGAMKLSPQINREMHREIRRQFVQYAKVFPMATTLGIKLSAKHYRVVIGWTELVAGISLAFIPGRVKLVANALLLVITLGGVYTHVAIGDKFERIAPSIVFTLMLTCRLIVTFQVRRREQKQALDNQKPVVEVEESVDDIKKDN